MDRKIYVVIVAGGSGTRMKSPVPKQFMELGGVPVLQRTISRFAEAWPEAKIVTVLPEEHISTWKDMCDRNSFFVPQIIAKGGISRFHSVKNALKLVPDGAIVAVHDGVRPLVSVKLLQTLLAAMESEAAVVPALPVADSLKFKDGRLPEPDRSEIAGVQTPQIFRSEELKSAYCQPFDTAFTDDMSVAVRRNIPVRLLDGEKTNLKITTREDLLLAEALLNII